MTTNAMDDHLMDAQLLAHLDGEITEALRPGIIGHLEDCPSCLGRLEELRGATRRLSADLERLDAEPPWDGLPEVLRPGAASGPSATATPTAARRLAIAAVLSLIVVGGAAAIPGSPVREWAASSVRALGGLFQRTPPDTEPAAGELQAVAGVGVEPAGGRVTVVVTRPAAGLRVHVRLVDEPRASVSAARGSYSLGPGRIEVVEAAGEMRIGLPRDAEASILVDGRLAAVKSGSELRLVSPQAPEGPEILLETDG